MLKLVSDENFNGDILRGLFRRRPSLNVVRVQDVGLNGTSDSEILEWAASEGRIVLTHDRDTMLYSAYKRVRTGRAMPGVSRQRSDAAQPSHRRNPARGRLPQRRGVQELRAVLSVMSSPCDDLPGTLARGRIWRGSVRHDRCDRR